MLAHTHPRGQNRQKLQPVPCLLSPSLIHQPWLLVLAPASPLITNYTPFSRLLCSSISSFKLGFMLPTNTSLLQRRCEGHLARGGGEKTEMHLGAAAWPCISYPPPEPWTCQDFLALHTHISPSLPLSSSAGTSALPGSPQLQCSSRCSPRPFCSLPTKPQGGSSISLTNLGLNKSNLCCLHQEWGPAQQLHYLWHLQGHAQALLNLLLLVAMICPFATGDSWILGTANPKNNNFWKKLLSSQNFCHVLMFSFDLMQAVHDTWYITYLLSLHIYYH